MEAENSIAAAGALAQRLAHPAAEPITVVTPNRRLAGFVRSACDRLHLARGASAWESADVVPFEALLDRLWDDLLYADAAEDLPLLMTPAQEEALWDEAVRAAPSAKGLLAPAATAARARDAWRLAHAWRLLERTRGAAQGDDTRAFLDWAARFERLCMQRHLLDSARLPDELVRRGAWRPLEGRTLVLHGFDIVAPQLQAFVDALERGGVAVERSTAQGEPGRACRVAFARPADEHWAAARWARSRLERDPAARIGIVVPDLAHSRDAVERALLRVMLPDAALPGTAAGSRPFDLSLGRPLADTPLVADALAILSLLHGEVDFEAASRVVRSPFIAAAVREAGARARLDARLRERCGARVDLAGLILAIGAPLFSPATVLAERLERLAQAWRARSRAAMRAADWASAWADALRAIGFPGERACDSLEYQALQKWHETLAAFGTLERVTGRLREGDALARLAHIARETVFQPESADPPVVVMGILESAGLEFDHLWVMGMTDDAWPLPARPDPFIPVRVQREAGVPAADPAASLALDRRITQGWLAAAREIVFSHARMRGDEELSVSPLCAHVPQSEPADLDVSPFLTLAEAIRARRACETIPDGVAPAIVAPRHPGGTSLFQNQAACPFRAFARNRLASRAPGPTQPGLDAAGRGTLLHHVLASFWDKTRTREALVALSRTERAERLRAAADEAMARLRRRRPQALEGRLAEIERDRLVQLAGEWLELELRRGDFEVVATESPVVVAFGGVSVDAKVDRIDALGGGAHAVLDYKTGAAAVRSWLPPRPDEPQLPMYALTVPMRVDALAFARVRPGELAFAGLARAADLLPDVPAVDKHRAAKSIGSWDALKEVWRAELEALGSEFASGVACVRPKNGAATCRQCDQQVLCRIDEKRPQVEATLPGSERDE